MQNFIESGQTVNYTEPGSAAISSGDVVEMGDKTLGVALGDIAISGTGPVAILGGFSVTKVAGTAWAVGDVLDWDTTAGAFDRDLTLATGDIGDCGIVLQAAASGDVLGVVGLMPGKPVT